jgi:hypothetical protein
MAGTGSLICLILASLSPAVSWAYWPIWCIIMLGVLGVILVGLSFRKVEFACFRSDAAVVVLDVARAGPDRDGFDEFVKALAGQIQVARGAAQPGASPNCGPTASAAKSGVTNGPQSVT